MPPSVCNAGAIVYARTGASRLPGKVLKPLCGKPVLWHVVQRLQRVRNVPKIVVATTVNPGDDAIETLCRENSWEIYRGSEDNVLQRTIETIREFDIDPVVRLGADSPLLDPEVISEMMEAWRREAISGRKLEYASNTLDRSYPLGVDAEIFAANTFLRIERETAEMSDRERHINESNVVPYLHANLDLFKHLSFKNDRDLAHHRWTLDTPEDFELITKIYEALYPKKPDFGTMDILGVLEHHPEWFDINAGVVPTTGYWTKSERDRFAKTYGREGPPSI